MDYHPLQDTYTEFNDNDDDELGDREGDSIGGEIRVAKYHRKQTNNIHDMLMSSIHSGTHRLPELNGVGCDVL